MAHKCFVENCKNNAPFGYRWPGHMSEIKPEDRGYLWACLDHREKAEQRRDAALEERRGLSKPVGDPQKPGAESDGQLL